MQADSQYVDHDLLGAAGLGNLERHVVRRLAEVRDNGRVHLLHLDLPSIARAGLVGITYKDSWFCVLIQVS